jgi:hypothetical protein
MPISCYNYAELQRHIDALKRPKLARAMGRLGEGLEFKFGWGPASATVKPNGLFFPESSAYRFAALDWIRAHSPHLGLKDVDRLKSDFGLTKHGRQLFLARLQDECIRCGHEDGELLPWLQRRTGLLEFETGPRPKFREELQDAVVALRADYELALWEASTNLEQAVVRAIGVSRRALESAGQVVVSLFATQPCDFSANLMLPGPVGPTFTKDAVFQRNAQGADEIWEDLRYTGQRLTIVVETRDANHLGFWVPANARGTNGEELPGATAASSNMTGSAVFKYDPPPLLGFPPNVNRLWGVHMDRKFADTLFVSLPLKLPSSTPGTSTVHAVLNVNANANSGEGWERATHREWLELARDRVAQFLEVGFKALVLINEAGERGLFPELPQISARWGSLPAAPNRRLLP